MSALDGIRAAVEGAFASYQEQATLAATDGTTRTIDVIRMEQSLKLSPVDQGFEDEGPFVYAKTGEVAFERGDQLTMSDGTTWTVNSIERHSLRGYVKLLITEQ
jgi:hypothetical protein